MIRPSVLGLVLTTMFVANTAAAQTQPASRPPATPADPFTVRGFGDIGFTSFTAAQSFKAIFGTSSGQVFGGGVEVGLARHIFVNLRASRFRRDGHRVFVFGGDVFDLRANTTVTIDPLELTAGYRFDVSPRLVAYGGGGVGWHRYQETSDFATDNEEVKDTFTGYQLLGGAEFRFSRLLGAAAEVEWAIVPNALGQDPNGVSNAFDEHDLGGSTFRVKIVVGH